MWWRCYRRRFDAKEVSTPQRAYTLHRPYFYGDTWQVDFHPLDTTLQLSADYD